MKFVVNWAGVLTVLLLAANVVRAEQVSNPVYESWAKCLPGTTVSQTAETNIAGQIMLTDITQKLIEVTPEAVKVEMSLVMQVNGQKMTPPPQQKSYPATVAPGAEVLPPETKGTCKAVGKERLIIRDKEYECTIYEFSGEKLVRSAQGKATHTGRIWHTVEIPGAQARMESTVEVSVGGTPTQGTINMFTSAVDVKPKEPAK